MIKNILVIISVFHFSLSFQTIDYSDLKNWAAHSLKKDFSDSISAPFNEMKIDGRVDVFFLYPTIYVNSYNFTKWNTEVDNEKINNEVDNRPILLQSTAFNIAGPVYSPRYRQAHLDIYSVEDKNLKDSVLNFAYEDIRNAFQYYLEHWNNGRPIIIAAHSQGSTMAGKLLKEFFEGKPLNDKLVVAYVVGSAIPDDYFTQLKVCTDSTQTNCFVGWRTFQNGYLTEKIKNEKFKSVVVNPLTWKTEDNNFGSYELNKGSILFDFNKIFENLTDAKISGNVLWINRPRVWWSWFYPTKDFHQGDINLFYQNIRENVLTRIKSYFKE